MKTAVEWLEEQTRKPEWHSLKRQDIFEQAKEMEDNQKKELVIATYTYLKMKDCQLPYGMEYLNKISELDEEAEQYYNKTFKQQANEDNNKISN